MSRDERALMITGPAGQLEISVNHHPDSRNCVIICHPHPQHGGTMNNKVVTTLAKGYQLSDFTTIRFNYRGVGKSEGEYDEGRGETEDLKAVIAWAREHFKREALHLAGFSFGTFVVMNALQELEDPNIIHSVITVAPTVRFYKEDLEIFPSPWLVIQCDDDEVVASKDVYAWLDNLYEEHRPDVVRFQQAGHFFHGRLIELRTKQIEWLSSHVTA